MGKQQTNDVHSDDNRDGMQLFSSLVQSLGNFTKTNDKLEALVSYFSQAPDRDRVWMIALFSGRRPKRILSGSLLAGWACELAALPDWLFEESYHTIGDLAETIALFLPNEFMTEEEHHDLSYYLERIVNLQTATEAEKKSFVLDRWNRMNVSERFVFNKLLTGGFRIGVSQKLVTNALARVSGQDASTIAHKISGNWDPLSISFQDLLGESSIKTDFSKPYPFFLAHALATEPEELGTPEQWQAEWKWDGIRGQIIKRNDELFVWSRGEELMTEKFPEYFILKDLLPNGTVIDGEIIPIENGKVLPFAVLQTRIGRKNLSKKNLLEAPVGFIAYDILEWNGNDIRNYPLAERRRLLEKLIDEVGRDSIVLSTTVDYSDWQQLALIRERSREENAEGLMLKRKDSLYGTGRKTGDWWKWKINPLTIDAVMVYAQKGHGRRSNLYTDYTFAVRDGDQLVTFAKAYSGLTDEEFRKVDAFVKRNSLEKFGPVRTVKPELVFEIAFEGIAESKRHKSGVALRFPRINRWRHDKKPDEINTLQDLQEMLKAYGKK